MADEIIKRDQNTMIVAAGITDDSAQEIRMFRVDPVTKRLLISAVITGVPSGSGTANQVAYWTSSSALSSLSNGTSGWVLTSNGAGSPPSFQAAASNSIVIGTTAIVSGTTTRILYNNAGVVGEYTISGSGNVAMTTSPVFTTPNIGNATGNITGNAGTATALQNARTIGGVSFDGTANITVATATGGFTVSGGNLALGANSLTMTGSLAATGARVTKGWFTDVESTNMPTVGGTSLSSTFSPIAGSASITTLGTVTTGTWQATVISSTYGGTGVNNGGRTLTIATNSGTIAFGAASKTLTINNTLAFSGTDSTVMTFPTTSKTIAANDGSNWTFASQAIGDIHYATSTTAYGRLAAVALGSVLTSAGVTTAPAWSSAPQITSINLGHASDTTLARVSAGVISVEGVTVATSSNTLTVTNKRNQPRIVSAASYTTDTGTSLDVSTCDIFVITAQAGALLFNAPSGTPVQGEKLVIRIKDNGTARALTWNAVFRAMGTALPTTTILSKTLYLGFYYNSTDTKWDLVASAQEA